MRRFSRTRLLLGEGRAELLAASHVAVFGLGAVGGYAVEGLARAGVGRLTLVDFDLVQATDINRQILALDSTVGRAKAAVAAERVTDINPECEVVPLSQFADRDSVGPVLDRRPDVVIDAIDSLNPKVQLLAAARHRGLSTLSSMGAALRTDPLKIRVGDIARTNHCPLARRLRKRLKSDGIESGITCVYSVEPVDFAYGEPVEDNEVSEIGARGRKRRTLGSLPTLTAMFGLILANEAIKTICRLP